MLAVSSHASNCSIAQSVLVYELAAREKLYSYTLKIEVCLCSV